VTAIALETAGKHWLPETTANEVLVSLSHELRAPLNSVIGLSTVLSRQLYGPLTDKQAEYISQIESSGRHLLAIIANILDLAKAESSKLEVDLEDVDVAEVVKDSVDLVAGLACDKCIAMTVSIPADLPLVSADPLRAKQILINLLSNAVKFTDPGGSVGVRVGVSSKDGLLMVDVWDTGSGIPPEHLDVIFEPFEQVGSPSRKQGGAGLGLALSRHLAILQGGALTARSVVGKGSAFSVTFPMSKRSLRLAG
jgi:two-component system, NtrC family, sensor kinase